MTATAVAREFWRLMASNDFDSVAAVLAPDFVLEWPQSRERIRGAERFARMNREDVAHDGRFADEDAVVRGPADEDGVIGEAVSEVEITDGTQNAKAISFFTVQEGQITRLVEYWPEPYPAPANRSYLTEPLEGRTA